MAAQFNTARESAEDEAFYPLSLVLGEEGVRRIYLTRLLRITLR
jgi:hypothetical protein